MSEREFFNDLWKAMIEQDISDELQDGEMTAEMYAEQIHKSTSTAARLLRRKVQDGILTRRKTNINRKAGWAYKPVAPVPHRPSPLSQRARGK
jgi:predicted transcriptional regulator